jgi:hypothetical protein
VFVVGEGQKDDGIKIGRRRTRESTSRDIDATLTDAPLAKPGQQQVTTNP